MENKKKVLTPRRILQLSFILIIIPLLPILISGHWDWGEAWVYAGVNLLGFAISRALAARRHPDLIAERARSMELKDAKPWDKKLAPMLTLGLALALMLAGLDARNGWTSPFPPAIKLASLLIILLGYALGSWALIENRFFSGVVRIQTDRGQHVVSGGPYRYVRHPGYAGAIWTYLLTPVFLDSLWALLPVGFTLIVLIVRTSLEDRTLQEELPGYRDYARKTRYRLFPGIW